MDENISSKKSNPLIDPNELGSSSNLVVDSRESQSKTKISSDSKQMLIKCYEEGKTIVEASIIAGINNNTAMSIINRYRKDGSKIIKKNRGGRRMVKLTDAILKGIEKIIEENPCITLKNIKSKILETENVILCTSSIFNSLKTLKISRKIPTINLDLINCVNTIEERKKYAINFLQNAPQTREKIVFIGETSFNCHLRKDKATIRGRITPLIAAMNYHGIVHSQVIAESTVKTNIFITFLDQLFLKLDEANITDAWLVLDNGTIHKTDEFDELVSETNHTLIFLSPYSAMLNPIEKVFSKIKLSARDLLADSKTKLNLVNVIKRSVVTISSADCNTYYDDMSMKLSLAADGLPLH